MSPIDFDPDDTATFCAGASGATVRCAPFPPEPETPRDHLKGYAYNRWDERVCNVLGCSRVHEARGRCSLHYYRWWKRTRS